MPEIIEPFLLNKPDLCTRKIMHVSFAFQSQKEEARAFSPTSDISVRYARNRSTILANLNRFVYKEKSCAFVLLPAPKNSERNGIFFRL
jgi:hypothetical protein